MSEEDVLLAARNGLTVTAADVSSAKLIAETAEKYRLSVCTQVKVNTGMNRYGTYGSTLGKVCKILKRTGQVRVQGVYSHLYSHDKSLCEAQRMRFCHGLKIARKYFPLARAHLAATFGVGLGEEYYFDAVRIGLGLYGYYPEGKSPVRIRPVMKAYAPCVALRKYRFGGMGYGLDRAELQGKTVSVLRAGYADGIGFFGEGCGLRPRLISGNCMDVCFAEGERKQGKNTLLFDNAAAVAKERGTSVYEVLCLAALRAQRIYYG
jgi:alanine racemase